jgi:segregation and condensation protein A
LSTYTVNTELFQGPFDLLLHLVSRQKLDVNALSLSQIVDEYIAHIETMRELDLDIASEFLVLAAQLIEIKGLSLLPKEEVVLDEEFDDLGPGEIRDLLVARLIAYRQYKSIAAHLEARLESQSHLHARRAGLEPHLAAIMPDFLEGMTLESLARTVAELEARRDIFLLEADHIASAPISLRTYAEKVQKKLKAGVSKTFKELLSKSAKPEEIVVTFLAVLELYKRGLIDMSQKKRLGDIELTGLSVKEAAVRGIMTEDFDEY